MVLQVGIHAPRLAQRQRCAHWEQCCSARRLDDAHQHPAESWAKCTAGPLRGISGEDLRESVAAG
jgi:hypothetical protein